MNDEITTGLQGKTHEGKASSTAVSCEGVTVQFADGRKVLNQLCLEVTEGEIVSLLGPSGCGKSTLLRAIAGLQPLSSGRVLTESTGANSKLELSFVFQDPTLLPWRTVAENVMLPLQLRRAQHGSASSEDQGRKVQDALEQVGLGREHLKKFPSELSGGMRMRASLARALITDPAIMLLDEPFAALDDILRTRLNELLLEIWERRRRTILFVTHNIAEAIFLSHRIAILSEGRIFRWIEIPWKFPRNRSIRSEAGFGAMYGKIAEQLGEATLS
jgi:NitT/TauT family transport system ATP-binding protein